MELDFGFVTDEIDTDAETALRAAREWGVRLFEIRTMRSGRVPDISHEDLQMLRVAVRGGGARVTALSPGIFKRLPSETDAIEHEIRAVLPRSIAMARELDAGIILVFGFMRPAGDTDESFDRAVAFMRRAADLAARAGMKIAVENEPGYYCDSGSNTAAFLRAVDSPAAFANWDPANAIGSGERPYPEGYEAVRRFIANVHAKDTTTGSLVSCVPVGEGSVDWAGQIEALCRDGIVPHVTIETHCHPLAEMSQRNLLTLRALAAAAKGRSALP